jgi:putative spermidine/putrescine transport system substrate-binding protein
MINRRDFLLGLGSLALAELLLGCSQQQADLNIMLLRGSIPSILVKQFKKQFEGKSLEFKPETDLNNLFKFLQNSPDNSPPKNQQIWLPWQKSQTLPQVDLLTLGDYWLQQAIEKELIEPLNLEELSGWQNLTTPWQDIVKRNNQGNLDPQGKIWGAPYRWGTTMIAYRSDKLETIKDWSDLWRKELSDRLSLLNQPREVIGLVLKKLGYSYNETNLSTITQLKSELLTLNQQVKFYDSTDYLQPLILGDTWVAVGWSSDIIPVIKSYSNIEAIIPLSGTALWADIWVKPKKNPKTENLDLIKQWIDFCWQPLAANKISLSTPGVSPSIFGLNREELSQDIFKNPLIYPQESILNNSEFILPLSKETEQEYLSLWEEMRQRRKNET